MRIDGQNKLKGTSTIGDSKFNNQFGVKGTILRSIKNQNRSSLLLST